MISGDCTLGNPEYFLEAFKNITSIFEKNKQPYLYVLGNHDHYGDFTPEQIYEMDRNVGGSLRGDQKNVRLGIYDRLGNVVFNVWAFDTRSSNC